MQQRRNAQDAARLSALSVPHYACLLLRFPQRAMPRLRGKLARPGGATTPEGRSRPAPQGSRWLRWHMGLQVGAAVLTVAGFVLAFAGRARDHYGQDVRAHAVMGTAVLALALLQAGPC